MGAHQRIGTPAEYDGGVRDIVGQLSDENALLRASIGEMREHLHALEEESGCDVLTLLPNKRRFGSELDRVVAQANRHGTPGALLHVAMLGLDRIAARHGQSVRDAALVHVAGLLAGLIRGTDVAARTGAASFGLILDHLDHNSAIDAAERIAGRVRGCSFDPGIGPVRIDVAIGVASIAAGDMAADVVDRAERNAARTRDLI